MVTDHTPHHLHMHAGCCLAAQLCTLQPSALQLLTKSTHDMSWLLLWIALHASQAIASSCSDHVLPAASPASSYGSQCTQHKPKANLSTHPVYWPPCCCSPLGCTGCMLQVAAQVAAALPSSVVLLGLLLLGNASAAKATSATLRVIQLSNLLHHRSHDALQDELSDAVALLDLEVDVAVVEQDHLNVATVVLVDDTSTSVNGVLPGQARARSDASIRAVRHLDGNAGVHHGLATGGDHGIL
mmetsp:Transcript_7900/g.19762  ORF Transcript_7900/g.19762 Transcript_7900/m.19762 type:complete len:242 (-) Transcript_7900:236-961(-)